MEVLVDAERREIVDGRRRSDLLDPGCDVCQSAVHYYPAGNIQPTVSELIPTVLGELQPLDRAICKSAIRTERS